MSLIEGTLELDVGDNDLRGDLTHGPEYYNTLQLLADGDPTPNKGPCPCGYKHWHAGIEYDYIVSLWVEGKKFLGFNANEDPFKIAQTFMTKHKLIRNSFQHDQQVLNSIVQTIIEAAPEMELEATKRASSPAPAAITQPPATAAAAAAPVTTSPGPQAQSKPAAATLAVPNQGQAPVRPKSPEPPKSPRSDEEIKREEEARKARAAAARMAEQQEKEAKEKIKQQIKIDQENRQKEAREAAEKRKQLSQGPALGSSGKMVIGEDGNLVPLTESQTTSAPAAVRQQPQQTQPTPAKPAGGGFRTLSDLSRDHGHPQATPQPQQPQVIQVGGDPDLRPEQEMMLRMLMSIYRQFGRNVTIQRMFEKGANRTQIQQWLSFIEMRLVQEEMLRAQETGQKPNLDFMRGDLGKPVDINQDFVNDDDEDDFDDDYEDPIVRRAGAAPGRSPVASGGSPVNGTVAGAYPVGAQPVVTSASASGAAAPGEFVDTPAPTQTPPVVRRKIVLNADEPTTNIAVRLHNGQQLKLIVNLTHTVQDLVEHVASEAPIPEPFNLVTGFPPRQPLSDMLKTVKEAGLAGAVVIQSIIK